MVEPLQFNSSLGQKGLLRPAAFTWDKIFNGGSGQVTGLYAQHGALGRWTSFARPRSSLPTYASMEFPVFNQIFEVRSPALKKKA